MTYGTRRESDDIYIFDLAVITINRPRTITAQTRIYPSNGNIERASIPLPSDSLSAHTIGADTYGQKEISLLPKHIKSLVITSQSYLPNMISRRSSEHHTCIRTAMQHAPVG